MNMPHGIGALSIRVLLGILILMGGLAAQDSGAEEAESPALFKEWNKNVGCVFADIHVADLLEVFYEEYNIGPIYFDQAVIGHRVGLSDPEPIPLPSDGVTPPPYASDGMIEYVKLSDVTLLEALEAICDPLGLVVVVEPYFLWITTPEMISHDSVWGAEPGANAFAYENKLDSLVSIEFEQVHLREVVEFFIEEYKVNIVWDFGMVKPPEKVVDPAWEENNKQENEPDLVNVDVRDVTLLEALREALSSLGIRVMENTYEGGNYVLLSVPEFSEYDTEPRSVSDLKPEPFDEVPPFDIGLKLDELVSLRADRLELRDFIFRIERRMHDRIVLEKSAWIFLNRNHQGYRTGSGNHAGLPVRRVKPDPVISVYPKGVVTDGTVAYINLRDVSMHEVLRGVLRPLGLSYGVRGNYVWASTPESVEAVLREGASVRSAAVLESEKSTDKLLDSPVGAVFEDIHIQDLLDVIIEEYELNIVLDQKVVLPSIYGDENYGEHYGPAYSFDPETEVAPESNGMIRYVDMRYVKFSEVIDALCRQLGLAYRVVDGGLFISSVERFDGEDIQEKDWISVEKMNERMDWIMDERIKIDEKHRNDQLILVRSDTIAE